MLAATRSAWKRSFGAIFSSKRRNGAYYCDLAQEHMPRELRQIEIAQAAIHQLPEIASVVAPKSEPCASDHLLEEGVRQRFDGPSEIHEHETPPCQEHVVRVDVGQGDLAHQTLSEEFDELRQLPARVRAPFDKG
jgi:hypothetical protein